MMLKGSTDPKIGVQPLAPPPTFCMQYLQKTYRGVTSVKKHLCWGEEFVGGCGSAICKLELLRVFP